MDSFDLAASDPEELSIHNQSAIIFLMATAASDPEELSIHNSVTFVVVADSLLLILKNCQSTTHPQNAPTPMVLLLILKNCQSTTSTRASRVD